VEIIARFTRHLRESSAVDQRSGVSARFSIAAAETVAAAALHRATDPGRARGGGPRGRPAPAVDVLGGKVEFETGEEGRERAALDHLLRTATAETAREAFRGIDFRLLVEALAGGVLVMTGDQVSAADVLDALPILGESELYDEVAARVSAPPRVSGPAPSNSPWRGSTSPSGSARTPTGPARSTAKPLEPPMSSRRESGTPHTDRMPGATPSRRRSTSARRCPRSARTSWPGYSPRPGAGRVPAPRQARTSAAWTTSRDRSPRNGAELLQRHNLDGTMQQVKELLDKAVLAERKQLARDLDDDARFQEMRLDGLPPSPAAAVNSLADYPWRSSDARAAYEEIKDLLGRELLDQRFAGMKQALEGATDEDRARINEMLGDLNDLLEKHRLGEDTNQDLADFMAKHGDFFPENPQSVEELIDALAQRAAAAQRMLNSMTPEQRAELMTLSQQAFGSPQMMDSLSRFDANLQMLRPGEDWSGGERFQGDEGLGLGDGTGAFQDLAELDALVSNSPRHIRAPAWTISTSTPCCATSATRPARTPALSPRSRSNCARPA
jgi:hypothetical protein